MQFRASDLEQRSTVRRMTYISSCNPFNKSASSLHVRNMCNAFAERGWSVELCGFTGTDDQRAPSAALSDGVSLHLRPAGGGRAKRVPRELAVLASVLLSRPAFVHGRDDLNLALACAFFGQSTTFEAHTNLLETYSERARRKFWRLLAQRSFRKLIVTSETLRDSFVAAGVSSRQIQVLRNAFRPVGDLRLPQLGPGFHVGYIGHLYPGKGMEITAELVEHCPFATFHIIGGTDRDVAQWQERLSRYSNVRFYGHVSEETAAEYRGAMDVLLLPMLRTVGVHGGNRESAEWMMPIKLFEYLAAGKPIIATDFPIIREVVEDRRSAILCPPESIQIWASELERLCKNPRLRAAMSDEAIKISTSVLTWSQRAAAIEKIHARQES